MRPLKIRNNTCLLVVHHLVHEPNDLNSPALQNVIQHCDITCFDTEPNFYLEISSFLSKQLFYILAEIIKSYKKESWHNKSEFINVSHLTWEYRFQE